VSRRPGRYRVLGRTRDDAAGEAYDKVARLLGLGYPGGPVIDRLAKEGDPKAVEFPRPYMPDTWDFSFSGLKTAVLYHVQKRWPAFSKGKGPAPSRRELADVCAGFQEALVDALTTKLLRAAKQFKVRQVVVGGGVSANSRLRQACAERGAREGFEVALPPPWLSTDNGVMIAQVGTHMLRAGRVGRRTACDPGMPFPNWAR